MPRYAEQIQHRRTRYINMACHATRDDILHGCIIVSRPRIDCSWRIDRRLMNHGGGPRRRKKIIRPSADRRTFQRSASSTSSRPPSFRQLSPRGIRSFLLPPALPLFEPGNLGVAGLQLRGKKLHAIISVTLDPLPVLFPSFCLAVH